MIVACSMVTEELKSPPRKTNMQVVFLSMLGRSTDDEMGRITQQGSQHAADAWTRIATHASKPEEQLQARQQVSPDTLV